MNQDLSEELDRCRREALRDYSSSHMSNMKWREVLSCLREKDLGVQEIIVKFVGVEEEKTMGLPWLHAPHEFVDSFEFGPFPLVAIEWIAIPTTVARPQRSSAPSGRPAQNKMTVRSALESLGKQLPLQDTATGLRIIGHAR